jgi:putative ribosome biogenesis GTPase RsgA
VSKGYNVDIWRGCRDCGLYHDVGVMVAVNTLLKDSGAVKGWHLRYISRVSAKFFGNGDKAVEVLKRSLKSHRRFWSASGCGKSTLLNIIAGLGGAQ